MFLTFYQRLRQVVAKGLKRLQKGMFGEKQAQINKTDEETLNYCKNGGNKQKVE